MAIREESKIDFNRKEYLKKIGSLNNSLPRLFKNGTR